MTREEFNKENKADTKKQEIKDWITYLSETKFEQARINNVMFISTGYAYEAINEIYDDFESRICKNCTYYNNEVCTNSDSPLCADFVDSEYGCNKFKRGDK